MQFDLSTHTISGPAGNLAVSQEDDEILRKVAMLIEGECEGLGAAAAAAKYGYSRQRYYQILTAFRQGGCLALRSRQPGPKAPSRRTPDVVREVIRHRFLDPNASADVIAQKIRQTGSAVAVRSVYRILEHYGLQKKTLCLPANGAADDRGLCLQGSPP
jgi:transposase